MTTGMSQSENEQLYWLRGVLEDGETGLGLTTEERLSLSTISGPLGDLARDGLVQLSPSGGSAVDSRRQRTIRHTESQGSPMTADQIRAIRRQHNLTADNLAGLIGVSRKTVHNWEQELAVPTGPALLLLTALRDGTATAGEAEWSVRLGLDATP